MGQSQPFGYHGACGEPGTANSDASGSFSLTEATPGIYSGLLNLSNTAKYRLRIKTTDSKEYLSDYVQVKNAPPVDSVGFTAQADGVHIYVNAHDDANATKYYRWEYNEDWAFHTWYQAVVRAPQTRYQCYAKDVSSRVNLASTAKLSADIVFEAPIATIPSTSEKIMIKYSILVKQYALTSDGYSFWENLQKNSDQLGSIFDAQPSTNQTNYRCLSNPAEVVIGYLSAGYVSTKRIFISASQLLPTYAVPNTYGCVLDTAFAYKDPNYSDPLILGPKTGTSVIANYYGAPPQPFGAPTFVTYSTNICNDCTLRGGLNPPPFWK